MSEITRRDSFTIAAGAGLATAALSGADALAQGATTVPAPATPQPTFSLLLVNDIYKMGEDKGRGGFARLAAIVKAERAKGVPLFYAHAGDTISPSLMSGFDQGAHIVELLNIAPPDIFVPGNHEFDFGPKTYAARVGESKFPYSAANARGPAGAQLAGHKDRWIVELGGVKVGVFGVALQSTPLMSSPGDISFTSEMDAIKAQATALRSEGADLVVAVTHTDFGRDLDIFRSRLVDVLLTGHDHDLRVVYDGKTVMVESGEEGQYVTSVDMYCKVEQRDGKRAVSFTPSFRVNDSAFVTPDPDALAVVKRYEGALSRELDVEIGKTTVELDSRSAIVRSQEAAVGNLIADAIRDSTEADCAITNGGGIRANKQYPAGATLTRRDMLNEMPFGNTTVMVEITGADIKAALENGISQIDARAGRFPQVSNMKVVFDTKSPVGQRVVSVSVKGEPLNEDKKYKVATNDFMLAGGDGYASLGKGRALIGKTDGKLMANVVMAYVRTLGTVSTKPEGRIVLR